jgi:hypothetical protein
VFLISPQLKGSEVILGCNYAHEYGIVIDFVKKCLHYERDGVMKTQLFCQSRGKEEVRCDENVQAHSIPTETGRLPTRFTATQPSCEVPYRNPLSTGTFARVEASDEPSSFCKSKDVESVRQRPLRCNDARCSQDECYEDIKICEVNVTNRDEVYCNEIEGSVVKDFKRDMERIKSVDKTEQDVSDPRSLRTEDLYALIGATEGLNSIQKECLINLLLKDIKHMTLKPGMCRVFEYKFRLSDPKPIMGFSRALFTLL